MHYSKFLLTIYILVFTSVCLHAHQPYHAEVSVGNESIVVSAPNLVDLNRELKTSSLESLLPFYTPTSAVSIGINLRGLPALTTFVENSTTLIVTLPNSGITESFTGGTRDESLVLFKEFIKEGSSLPRLLKGYARYSTIDPIAGNPYSLMAQMAQADYLLGTLSPFSGCDECWSAQPIVHQFQAGTNVGRGFSRGYDTTCVTLPIRYSYSPDLSWALILDAPFTYNRNGGASSVFGSLGFGLRLPFTNDWSVTPTLRVGAGGSLDLCTSGTFVTAGVVSAYNYKISEYILTLTDYVGYFNSTNLWLTGVNFNYHLHNTVFKNGLSLNSCDGWCLFGHSLNFRTSFTDSYFAGSRLYIRHFDEVAVALITTNVIPFVESDCLTLEFAYQWGQKGFNGYNFNMAYQF